MTLLRTKYKTLLDKFKVNTPLRLAHFFAQIDHESGLKPIEENLNYSSERLLQVFPKYFNEKNVKGYHRFPEAIANVVYANRIGNGDYNSKDGWKYRGRGFIQLTGKENYKNLSKDTEVNYLNNPDLLLNEADAMNAALWFWNKNNLNSFADKDDVLSITKKINGGTNGLAHRKELLKKYKKEFAS